MKYFTIKELTKSTTATAKKLDNTYRVGREESNYSSRKGT